MAKSVTIYSTPACDYCQMAKEFFDEHNVEYTDHNVAEDVEKRQEMMEKTGQMSVPVIDIDDNVMVGFNKDKVAELLGVEK